MDQNNLPFISAIVPCRDEEKFIGKCLNSLIVQDFPKDKLEILVVDGMSEDKTREIEGIFYRILNRKMQILEQQRQQKGEPSLTQSEYAKEREKMLENLKQQIASSRMNWYKIAKLLD